MVFFAIFYENLYSKYKIKKYIDLLLFSIVTFIVKTKHQQKIHMNIFQRSLILFCIFICNKNTKLSKLNIKIKLFVRGKKCILNFNKLNEYFIKNNVNFWKILKSIFVFIKFLLYSVHT